MIRGFWRAAPAGLIALGSAVAQDEPHIVYAVSFENAAHHEAKITVAFQNIGDAPLALRMARSSPGRYAIHEFAKNVYAVSAVGSDGQSLDVTRTNPYSWRIDNHDGSATVSYTLFADHGDGTYSQIDATHAHLNMPATFMWAPAFEDRAVTVSFTPADPGWKAATQLQPTRRALTFTAPDLQYFMDSPVELSNFDLREWPIGDGARQQTIRIAAHHMGDSSDLDIFADKAKKIVAEQIRLFGEAPAFDHGVYTFIADYLPWMDGDGMEHRNSTILTQSESLIEDDFSQIDTLSHEFFHVWNVERLRPVELEPFDFTKANSTTSLWFAEGFTSYYGPLTIRRAGLSTIDEYLAEMSGRFSFVLNAPGRQFDSPKGMSLRAPFADAATAVDPTNFSNTFVSYYSYGAIVALALDLTIREQFPDLSLDDYMRHLWRSYGKSETPYSHQDLRDALGDVTGDSAFANAFFERYIENGELPDFAPLLQQAGVTVRRKNEGDASLGRVRFEKDEEGLIIASNTRIGSPLYDAGLDRGDEIMRIGRFRINNKKDWDRALRRHQPGDTAILDYRQRGRDMRVEITFVEDETLEMARMGAGADGEKALSDAQEVFRSKWLGPDVENE